MAYLALAHCLGNVLFLTRAWYPNSTLVASTIGSAQDLVSKMDMDRRNGKDGSQLLFQHSPQLQKLRARGYRRLVEEDTTEVRIKKPPYVNSQRQIQYH
jgi:hypothetical protein